MGQRLNLSGGETIVFIGNSITDAGRREPAYAPLGRGYVHFAANRLFAAYPDLELRIVNAGISGDTVKGMRGRWERDCISHQPDILSVLIGINDLWTQHAGAEYLPYAVYPGEYELTYRQLLSQATERCECKIVLLEPFMFCDDPRNEMFAGLRVYIETVHRLGDEFDAVVVPLQERIDERIKTVAAAKWSDDMVHPHEWAHAWIAEQWLDVTGL